MCCGHRAGAVCHHIDHQQLQIACVADLGERARRATRRVRGLQGCFQARAVGDAVGDGRIIQYASERQLFTEHDLCICTARDGAVRVGLVRGRVFGIGTDRRQVQGCAKPTQV